MVPKTGFRRRVPLILVLLTSAILSNAILTIYKVDRTQLLAVQYGIWAILAGGVAAGRRHRPHVEVRSPLDSISLWISGGLILSTFLVRASDLRADFNQMALQSGALAFLMVPFVVMQRAAKTGDVEGALVYTCHAILAICVVSVLGDFIGLAHYESNQGRFFGFLGDQVAWAVTLPLLVYFCNGRLVLAALAGLCIALTASRAPAFVVAGALLLIVSFSRGRRFQYALTILFMGLIVLYQNSTFQTLAGRITATQLLISDRVVTAGVGLRIFERSPIFGYGYNSLHYLYPTSFRKISLGILPNQTSTIVQVLSDGGLILFIPFIVFMVGTTIGALAIIKRSQSFANPGVMSGVAGWLIAMLWMNQSATWFFVGSYIGPLVFGLAGVVSGYWARLRSLETLRPKPTQL